MENTVFDRAVSLYKDYCSRSGEIYQKPSKQHSYIQGNVYHLRTNIGIEIIRYSIDHHQLLG